MRSSKIGVLELWGSQATSRITTPTEGRQKKTTGVGNETTNGQETRESKKKSEWRQRRNKLAERMGGESSGNERVPGKGGRRRVH
jgi:hypothetical protein